MDSYPTTPCKAPILRRKSPPNTTTTSKEEKIKKKRETFKHKPEGQGELLSFI